MLSLFLFVVKMYVSNLYMTKKSATTKHIGLIYISQAVACSSVTCVMSANHNNACIVIVLAVMFPACIHVLPRILLVIKTHVLACFSLPSYHATIPLSYYVSPALATNIICRCFRQACAPKQ
jgi:hypothetical protein